VAFPTLSLPPRPPELPSVPVAPAKPAITAEEVFPQGKPPPLQKWVEAGDRLVAERSLQLDAFLTKWFDEFLRILKDAWLKLQAAFTALEARVGKVEDRVTVLETRIADTYTFGQKGGLQVIDDDPNWIALPLLVVRDEVLVEIAVTVYTPSDDGDVVFSFQHNGAEVASLRVFQGDNFLLVPLTPPRPLAYNDVLLVQLNESGTNAENAVIEARCR
jgi:hypothetical protein